MAHTAFTILILFLNVFPRRIFPPSAAYKPTSYYCRCRQLHSTETPLESPYLVGPSRLCFRIFARLESAPDVGILQGAEGGQLGDCRLLHAEQLRVFKSDFGLLKGTKNKKPHYLVELQPVERTTHRISSANNAGCACRRSCNRTKTERPSTG